MQAAAGLLMAAAASHLPCDRIAATVRAQAATPASFQRALGTANGVLTPAIAIARTVDVSDRFADTLAAAFPQQAQEGAAQVERVGLLWRTTVTQGTLHCAEDSFFTRGADGTIHRLATPPAYSDLCWTNVRDLGTVFGDTALIERDEQDHPYSGTDIVVTPWQAGWRPACGIAVRYDDRFDLVERFCDDRAICAAGAGLAARLAGGLGRGDGDAALRALAATPQAVTSTHAAAFAAASRRISDYGDGAALPTFDAKAKTHYADYSYPTKRIMVTVNGTPLLARVGIGGIGWRQIGDYLVTLYRFGGARPAAVASYVIARRTTGLRSVAIFVPKPRHNDR